MGSKMVVIGVLAGLKGTASMLHAGSPIACRQKVSGILGLRVMNGEHRVLDSIGDFADVYVMVFRLQAVDVQASYPLMIKLPGFPNLNLLFREERQSSLLRLTRAHRIMKVVLGTKAIRSGYAQCLQLLF